MKNVLVITGTRPEAIKLLPVFKALKKKNKAHKTWLLATGQHGPEMMSPLLTFFDVSVDFDMKIENHSLNRFSAALMHSLDELFVERSIDMVVVQGDTTSSMISSLAAFYRGLKVAHVEAGLRTYDSGSPYPEEVNRRAISLIADLHFAPTEEARMNLMRERIKGHVEVVGNTGIDSLREAAARVASVSPRYAEKFQYIGVFKRTVVITAHRRENLQRNFAEIFAGIKQLAEMYTDYGFVFPLHLNPAVRAAVVDSLKGIQNIFLIDPVPYDEMVFLLKASYLIMTDSGGLQEEGAALNRPVIVLRSTTERPEGIDAGCSVLGGVTAGGIISAFDRIVSDPVLYGRMASAVNPYGDGNSSKRIASAIDSYFLSLNDVLISK